METAGSIGFVTSSLGAGGSERVLTKLANGWAEQGRTVEIISLSDRPSFYTLQPNITVHALGVLGASSGLVQSVINNVERLRSLRKTLKTLRPGRVITFGTETNVLVLLASLGLDLNVTVSERCDPNYYPSNSVWKKLRRIVYPWARRLVVQTEDARRYFDFMPSQMVSIIANPIELPAISGKDVSVSAPFILAAGRLTPQKGFDVLLKAFAKAVEKHDGWNLGILGEGPQRQPLIEMAEMLSISDRLFMPGTVKNIGDYMHAAELFVLSSRYEGFPNVLCEAMAAGKAVVAADCPSGPGEIVQDGVNGILVDPENVEALTSALRNLMNSPDLRERLGEKACEISGDYSVHQTLQAWDKALD